VAGGWAACRSACVEIGCSNLNACDSAECRRSSLYVLGQLNCDHAGQTRCNVLCASDQSGIVAWRSHWTAFVPSQLESIRLLRCRPTSQDGGVERPRVASVNNS
jgi:hypothetical protein